MHPKPKVMSWLMCTMNNSESLRARLTQERSSIDASSSGHHHLWSNSHHEILKQGALLLRSILR